MLDKEAVARAIVEVTTDDRYENLPDIGRTIALMEAEAAIRAMAEGLMDPSREMCKAAGHTFGTGGGWLEKHRNALRAEQRRVLGDET